MEFSLFPGGAEILHILPAEILESSGNHCYENMFIIIVLINIIIIINNTVFGAFMHINFKQACAVQDMMLLPINSHHVDL